jgi:hypothetical protein
MNPTVEQTQLHPMHLLYPQILPSHIFHEHKMSIITPEVIHYFYKLPGLTEKEIHQLKKMESLLKNTFRKISNTIVKTEMYRKKRLTTDLQYKIVSKALLKKPTDDVCPICYDKHLLGDVIQTSCNHKIGKLCYQQWVDQCNHNQKNITCPVCRAENPNFIEFRYRNMNKTHTKLPVPP